MVLPFGLSSDGQHNPVIGEILGESGCLGDTITSGRSTAYTPIAPPYSIRAHTNVSTGIPIIPSPYIDFIVVNGDDRSMIRCERKAVLENSVELAKMIHAGPNSGRKGDNHFQISNVDKHDFELLIRFLETKFVKYRDHLHILKILELAERYNCPDLIINCIRELDLQLSSATVLDVFRSLWFYQGITSSNQQQLWAVITTQDSAANKKIKRKAQLAATARNSNTNLNSPNIPAPNPNPFTAEDYGVALLNNALQLIDMHAELILTKPEINELRFEELEMIAKRDALQLSSELILFTCLADWSVAECKRKHLDATSENRQRVLGPLCLTPRYCCMSRSEFRKACDRVEFLNPTETSLITDCIEDFFRGWLECELDLQDMIQTNSYSEALHKAMVIRNRKLLEHDAFVAALYLDHRFNFEGTPLLTNDQKQTAMDHLMKTYDIIKHISHSTSSQDEIDNISFSEYSNSLDTRKEKAF